MIGGLKMQLMSESEGLLCHDVVEVLARDLPAVGGSTLQHFL